MKFFENRYGNFYPVDGIARIRPYNGERDLLKFYYDTVEMKDGEETMISSSVTSELMGDVSTLLPAQDGFTLLKFWYRRADEGDPYVSADPVIGWKISAEFGVAPITIDEEEYDDRCGILCPDGRVRNYDTTYDDRASWETGKKEEAEAAAKAISRRAAEKGEGDPE